MFFSRKKTSVRGENYKRMNFLKIFYGYGGPSAHFVCHIIVSAMDGDAQVLFITEITKWKSIH